MAPYSFSGSLLSLEAYVLANDRDAALTSSNGLTVVDVNFLSGVRALGMRDDIAVTRALAALRPVKAPREGAKKSEHTSNESHRSAAIELEFRLLSRKASQQDRDVPALLEFLRRPEVLGNVIPTAFPVRTPDMDISKALEWDGRDDKRVCRVSPWGDVAMLPTGARPVHHAADLEFWKGAIDSLSQHLLVGVFFNALRRSAGIPRAALRQRLAEALLEILTTAGHASGRSGWHITPAVSVSSINQLAEELLQPGQHEAAPSDGEGGHGDPDGSSLLGGLDTLTQNATLAQLEALANHKQLSQSRHLIKAILTRITADVHDRTVVEGWDVAQWDHYFTKLEAYAPAGPAKAICGPISSAVAHVRLLRTFQAHLDPSKPPHLPRGSLAAALAPLLADVAAPALHRSHLVWDAIAAVDPCSFPDAHTAETQWTLQLLHLIWEASTTGLCSSRLFFDPSGPIHEALAGPCDAKTTPGSTPASCMHVVLASAHTPSLACALERFLHIQTELLRPPAMRSEEASGSSGAVGGGRAGGPGHAPPPPDPAQRAAALASAHSDLCSEVASISAHAASWHAVPGMRKPGWDNQGTTVATAITSLPFYNDSGSMEDLAAASILRFSPCNPTHSDCARPLTLWIDAKNAGRSATVSVYRIDIEGWLCSTQNTGYNVEVGPEADLSGVAPSAVLTVAMADSMTAVERVKVDVPDTAGRRGSFVVDVAAGGTMCRAVIQRGALRHVKRTTIAGHAFTLLYEDGTLPSDPSLRINGREHRPRPDAAPTPSRDLAARTQAERQRKPHEIFVPFPESVRDVRVVMCDGDVALSAAAVTLEAEQYELWMPGTVLDPMALVPGCTAILPIRAALTLNRSPAPLSLLRDVALTLTTTDSHGVEATTTVRDFELREPPLASEHSMRLPQSCRAVRLEVAARVARMAPGSNGERREETLAQHVSCAVAPGSCADAVASAHLSLSRSSKSEAVIQVLGKCGEPEPGVAVTVQLKRWAFSQAHPPVQARTDDSGCIAVEGLPALQWIQLCNDGSPLLPEAFQRTWDLPGLAPAVSESDGPPVVLESGADNWLEVPLTGRATAALLESDAHLDADRPVDDFVLVSTTPGGHPLQRFPVAIKGSSIKISGLEPGYYRLDMHPCQRCMAIRVVPPPTGADTPAAHDAVRSAARDEAVEQRAVAAADVLIGPHALRKCGGLLLPLTLDPPLHVRQFSCSAKHGIKACVGGGSGRRVACVTLSRFCRTEAASAQVRPRPSGGTVEPLPLQASACVFKDSIRLSDEQRYIQDRGSSGAGRAFATLPLAKPSLLTYPVSTGLARNVDPPRVAHGEAYGSQGAAVMAMQMCPPPPLTGARAPPMRRALMDEHDCGQPFCGPALLLSNVPLGETGELEVPAEDLPPDWATGFSVATLTVFCSAGSVAAAQAHVHCDPAPPPSAQPCVDPREGRRLPPDVPHVRRKRAVACAVGETLTVADVMAADVTVIDSMHDIHALFAALMRIEHPRALRAARHRPPHGAWAECAFLADWSTFAHETKLKMLADKPCYELFLFVKFCDEAFFLAHVVPLLAMRAPSEHDTMSLILTADTDALAPRMRDMHAVSRMTPLEVLLAGAVLRDAAVLRSAVLRWRLPQANRVLRQWEERRFEAALKHGSLSESAAPPQPPPPDLQASLPAPGGQPMAVAARSAGHGGGGGGRKKRAVKEGRSGRMARSSVEEEEEVDEVAELVGLRQAVASEATKEFAFESTMAWQEAGYWKEPNQTKPAPSTEVLSPFWADYAAYLLDTLSSDTTTASPTPSRASRPFLSTNTHTAALDFTTAAAAAGLLACTFQNTPTTALNATGSDPGESQPRASAQRAQHSHEFDGCSMRLTAASPFIAFTHELAVISGVDTQPDTHPPQDTQHPAGAPTAAAASSTAPAPLLPAAHAAPELLGYMSIVDPRDATLTDEDTGERRTKVATGPLRVHRVYVIRLVVSNPTPEERQLDVIVPRPGGAVAVGGAGFVDTRGYKVAPFACVQHEARFYFPEAGEFAAPVASILRHEKLAQTVRLDTGPTLQVVTRPPPREAAASGLAPGSHAWLLSTDATDADVVTAVANATHALPLAAIAWRAKRSVAFLRQLLAALRAAAIFDEPTWRLALLHGDAQGTLEWLAALPQLPARIVGAPFECGAAWVGRQAAGVRVREFWPLVNPRTHRLRGQPALVCPELQAAWRDFLCCASRTSRISPDDLLEAACFMAAMDRLPEAAELLRRADATPADPPSDIASPVPHQRTRMQRDYLWAFLTLSQFSLKPRGKPTPTAEETESHRISQHALLQAVHATVAEHVTVGSGRWRALWADMAAYVAELTTLCAAQAPTAHTDPDDDGCTAHGAHALSGTEPALYHSRPQDAFLSLDASDMSRGRVSASTPPPRHAAAAVDEGVQEWLEVAFREVDVETAFSMRPFAERLDCAGAGVVMPAWRARVPVHESGITELDLHELSPGGPVAGGVVEVRYDRLQQEVTALPTSLSVQLHAERGLLTVIAPALHPRSDASDAPRTAAAAPTRKAPVEGAYVKVYARSSAFREGKFWRDGYTDSLGRLEYARSTGNATSVSGFAVLVLSDEHGACISQVEAPSSVRHQWR